MKRTSLSLQKSCKQRWRTSAAHISHTQTWAPGAPRRALLTADGFQNVTSMLKHLEKIVLITDLERKDSGRRPGQGSYLAFFLFRERRRSVFARLSGRGRSRLYTFSPPYHFRDNHTKVFVSRSILARFQQATPRSKALDLRFIIAKQEVNRGNSNGIIAI